MVRRLRRITCVRTVQGMKVFSAWVPGHGAPDYEQDLHRVMKWLCEEERAVRDAWRGRVPQWRQAGLVLTEEGEAAASEVTEATRRRAAEELEAAGCAVGDLSRDDQRVLVTVAAQQGATRGGVCMTAEEAMQVVRSGGRGVDLAGVRRSTLGDLEDGETTLRGRPDTVVWWAPLRGKWVAEAGCVARRLDAWEHAGFGEHVLQWVRGVAPRWVVPPAPCWMRNHKSVVAEAVWVREEVQALVASGRMGVWNVAERGLPRNVMQAKVVTGRGGKRRLVANGALLSACEVDSGYPMQDIQDVAHVMGGMHVDEEAGEYIHLSVQDYAAAFHQLRVVREFYTYLCVFVEGVLLYYTVPVFGMKSSCSACCWCSSTSMEWAAGGVPGMRGTVYVDDCTTMQVVGGNTGRWWGQHEEVMHRQHSLGWVTDAAKADVGARVKDLGFLLDGRARAVELLQEKVDELAEQVEDMCTAGVVRARHLAAVYGKFIHAGPVVPGVQATLRGVVVRHFRAIHEPRLWDMKIQLAREDKEALRQALRLCRQARPWSVPPDRRDALVVRMDACDTGLGIVVLRGCEVLVAAYHRFGAADEARHITWKELRCFGEVDHVLRHVEGELQAVRGRVRVGTDNSAARASALRGSAKEERQRVVMEFWDLVAARGDQVVSVDYVPSVENWLADGVSRLLGVCEGGATVCSVCDGVGALQRLVGEWLPRGGGNRLSGAARIHGDLEWMRAWRTCRPLFADVGCPDAGGLAAPFC